MTPPRDVALDENAREALAALWAQSALFEHASIGSFAKFSLHLLAVGAPPELLYACQDAARDEIKHAELCFALASRYAERPLGPGPLPLPANVIGDTDLASVVRAAIEEGCVGETLASLEAAEALALAQDTAVQDVLRVIAEDEARHAELAWRFLAWALTGGNMAVRGVAVDAFRQALQEEPNASAEEVVPWPEALVFHGRLRPDHRRALFRQARRAVIRPAAEALLPELVRSAEANADDGSLGTTP